jgi:hypothetical protein
MPERLDENKTFNVIKELAKNKALNLNKIPNKIFKRVANATPTLIIRIF